MPRPLALIAVLFLAVPAAADDKNWTGKTVKLKESVKLGSKLGGGLVRDGAALEKGATFVVKSDDGGFLELVGQAGFIFKSDAEVIAGGAPGKADPPAKPAGKDGWATGALVLPKKKPQHVQFGDRDADGKQVYFELSGIMPMEVRKDTGDGWVRIHDRHREGWVSKDDLVTKEDAPIYWDRAIKANPRDSWAWYMRGAGWWQKGEPDNAIKDFNEAVRLEPGESAIYNARGNAWKDKTEYDKAIADYAESIRLNPDNPLAYHNRGMAWHAKGELDKAVADLTESIRLDPKYTAAYFNRAVRWGEKGEYDKAIADYTEAIRLDPNFAPAFYNRGIRWADRGEYDKAIADYTEAVRADPKFVGAYHNRGNAWYYKEEFDRAIADYDKALAVDPKYASALSNRGAARRDKGEYEKALADFDRAIDLDPNLRTAYSGRAHLWELKKEYEKALADHDKALELDPKNSYSTGARLNCLGRLKKYDALARGYEAALKANPSARFYRDYARFLAACPDDKFRDGKRAVELATKAVEKAGRNANWEYHAALAAAYAEVDDFELAVAEQRKALEDKAIDKEDRKKLEARLELYRAKKPYRDE
jgi:tetratricopeptide (TPR) repeat protein